MDTMICPHCGAVGVAGWPRCQRCNALMIRKEPTLTRPAAPTPGTHVPPPLPLNPRAAPRIVVASMPPRLSGGGAWLHGALLPMAILLLAIPGGLLMTGRQGQHELAFWIGSILGVAIGMAILPTLLGWILLATTRRGGLTWICSLCSLVALYLLVSFSSLMDRQKEMESERAAYGQMAKDELAHLDEPGKGTGNATVKPAYVGDEAKAASALAEPMTDVERLRFIRLSYVELNELARARIARYERESGAIPLEGILESENLVSRQRLQQSRRDVAKSQTLFLDYLNSMRQLNIDFEERLRKSVPSHSPWTQFWSNFEIGKQRRLELQQRFENNQRALYSEFNDVFDLMEANLGRVQAQGEQLYFGDQSASDSFNAHLARLQELAKQEGQLRAEDERITRDVLTRLQQATTNPAGAR